MLLETVVAVPLCIFRNGSVYVALLGCRRSVGPRRGLSMSGSLLARACEANARRKDVFSRHLGAVLAGAAAMDVSEAFSYFWDETPSVESAFGVREFPNISPSKVAPLFFEGRAPERPLTWAEPLEDGRLHVGEPRGLLRLGALAWEEEDAMDTLPEGAVRVLAVAVFAERTGLVRAARPFGRSLGREGRVVAPPGFWWRVPVGADGRARTLGGGSLAVLAADRVAKAAAAHPETLVKGNRDALYLALFALSCANARYEGDEEDLHGASLYVEDLLARLDRAGARTLGVGHALAACSHLFADLEVGGG